MSLGPLTVLLCDLTRRRSMARVIEVENRSTSMSSAGDCCTSSGSRTKSPLTWFVRVIFVQSNITAILIDLSLMTPLPDNQIPNPFSLQSGLQAEQQYIRSYCELLLSSMSSSPLEVTQYF